ncbi:LysR substrate-binding domain-containing protein [Comamonas thiooxydans]|uniref:LysR substrate-binding domain-containing protein n=1 Tax=Comamonas thiooxydans TaxID=363952 RepID=A0AA42Q0E6_9BURK|nr:LysR substrate-binding domain-containing protein [Comamonas thiooxydans]MDH1334987.1 LysR substrate-binding domain-containing protein [Comamonas thiooxydans]MDH1741138.1 LysR substrate-binding domain-containing protein [Comamonas thiooxydans]MDH1787466.1 LysR substrate-binding domain-containing protein [Comamonas thiooxydans]
MIQKFDHRANPTSPMKIQTLQALIHVEALGSIRAAAQEVALSQPALTAAIQQLEEELQAPLLVRTRQGATLTPFGRAFMGRARLIVAESQRAKDEIAQLRGNWEGSVRFSTSPAVALSILPLALQQFAHAHPQVQVHVRDGLYPGITTALRDGTLDFGLTPVTHRTLEEDLVAEPLFTSEIVIACQRDHRLRAATRIAELTECEWVFSSAPRGPGALIDEAFASVGLGTPRCGIVCESFLALPGIVARSSMMATIPRMVFETSGFRPELCRVPVTDRLPCPTVSVVRRHDLPLTPAASNLTGWIRHYALKGG